MKRVKSKDASNHSVTTERRYSIRHPITFPFRYRVVGSHNGEDRSKTINISRGGLFFKAKHPAKELSTVTMKIPFRNKVFIVRGRVAHCRLGLDKKCYEIGVSFYDSSDAFKTKLIEEMYLIRELRDLRSKQLGRKIPIDEAAKDWIKRYSKRFRKFYW